MTAQASPLILHASCVAFAGRGLLITGRSGAGKSALALRMIGLGARLVSDDRVALSAGPQGIAARCPSPAIKGLIEARGLGILRAATEDEVQLALVADLDQSEAERLPPRRSTVILGRELPLVLRPQNDHLPESLLLYLQHGRQD